MNNYYSITSNESKLFKHLDSLQSIQNKIIKPIMVHISPTNICNKTCKFCCFDDRDKKLEMPYETLSKAIMDFKSLGVKSIEFTGGGEPTLYPKINDAIDLASSLNLAMGINTNCLTIDKVKDWSKFSWVRISANSFDEKNKSLEKFKENVKYLKTVTNVTACYIVYKDLEDLTVLKDIIEFANENKILTRITPDCIQNIDGIKNLIQTIKTYISQFKDNTYAFCSDFNIYFDKRPEDFCAIHMIKPFLYTDGYIYKCPSSELAKENGKVVRDIFRVCKAEDILDYYKNNFEVFSHDCSYCKYTKQNEILYYLLMETKNNEFA